MKIGILAFHSANNYGAVLQVYAMQCTLKKYFDNVEVIDYRPESIEKNYENKLKIPKNSDFKSRLKSVLSFLYKYNSKRRKSIKFNRFISEYLNLSNKTYKTYNELRNLPYDTYILGSDQIWNPYITEGFDPAYFGVFLEDYSKAKKISYAASIGVSNLNQDQKEELKKLIENIDYISVREKQGKKILDEITQQNVEVVLDPTLLLTTSEWKNIITEPKVRDNYLLIYLLENNETMIQSARNLAKKLGIKVIEVKPSKSLYDLGSRNITDAGPQEMLGLIKNADIVVTNSFHGTTFSIVFRKNFYTYAHSKVPSRMEDLLSLFHLEERLIEFDQELPEFTELDYKSIDDRIENLRKKSLKYLEEALYS